MSFLNSDAEKILEFFYQNRPSFCGEKQIRETFGFNYNKTQTILRDLEIRSFISTTPNYPEGTLRPNPPKNVESGDLYRIVKRGIDYIEKQGDYKENISNIYNQTITNSPNSQIMADSPNSQQNISINNNLNDQDRIKLEDLNDKIDEFKKELSQIQQNITQSTLRNDKNIIEKFLSSNTLKFYHQNLI